MVDGRCGATYDVVRAPFGNWDEERRQKNIEAVAVPLMSRHCAFINLTRPQQWLGKHQISGSRLMTRTALAESHFLLTVNRDEINS